MFSRSARRNTVNRYRFDLAEFLTDGQGVVDTLNEVIRLTLRVQAPVTRLQTALSSAPLMLGQARHVDKFVLKGYPSILVPVCACLERASLCRHGSTTAAARTCYNRSAAVFLISSAGDCNGIELLLTLRTVCVRI